MDQSAAGSGERFADQPLVSARIRATIGRSYLGLGRLEPAGEHFAAALALYEKQVGELNADTLTALNGLATVRQEQGALEDSEAPFRRSLKIHEKLFGEVHPETLIAKNNLALVLQRQGKFADAEPLLREALAELRKTAGAENIPPLDAWTTLAGLRIPCGSWTSAALAGKPETRRG